MNRHDCFYPCYSCSPREEHCYPQEESRCEPQRHVHEVLGSVRVAELREDPHNHRFAGVSGEAILMPGGHVHEVCIRTDFYEDHYHIITAKSGPAIPVSGNRHVHFLEGVTSAEDGHCHMLLAASLIDNPIGE